ncbi:MAG: hypothetical protein HYZ94_03630 [Candidatus Omnitrophica bacterium]|nr:hypothetical protein [Candidatus Omnitrophota bacterium]
MRPPLEYGDNFPVAAGSWNPAVPWRFPATRADVHPPSLFRMALPWITLGLGVTLGMLWMSWRMEVPQQEVLRPSVGPNVEAVPAPTKVAPAARPQRLRSRVA